MKRFYLYCVAYPRAVRTVRPTEMRAIFVSFLPVSLVETLARYSLFLSLERLDDTFVYSRMLKYTIKYVVFIYN